MAKKFSKEYYENCNPCPMKNHDCPFLKKGIVCPEKDDHEEAFKMLLMFAANTRFKQYNRVGGHTTFEINGHNVAPTTFNKIYDWYNKNLLNFVATDTDNNDN